MRKEIKDYKNFVKGVKIIAAILEDDIECYKRNNIEGAASALKVAVMLLRSEIRRLEGEDDE